MATLLFGLSLLTFLLVNIVIDPIAAYSSTARTASEAQLAIIREHWGLDEPLHIRFIKWLSSLLQGDFGVSQIYKKPVADIIFTAFGNSLILMSASWLLSGIIGYFLGVISSLNRGKFIDKAIGLYCYSIASIPSFVIGLVLLIIFGVWLKIAPIGLSQPIGVLDADVTFFDRFEHFVLPCLTLSFLGVANVTLHTRAEMNDVLNSEYVMFAKARGMKPLEIYNKHGFRNTLLPVIVIQFAYFSELFGGSTLAEIVFSYHGLGSVMTKAGLSGDIPLLLASVLLSSIFVFSGNLIADILTEVVDPRSRVIEDV